MNVCMRWPKNRDLWCWYSAMVIFSVVYSYTNTHTKYPIIFIHYHLRCLLILFVVSLPFCIAVCTFISANKRHSLFFIFLLINCIFVIQWRKILCSNKVIYHLPFYVHRVRWHHKLFVVFECSLEVVQFNQIFV